MTGLEVARCANGVTIVFERDAYGFWTLHDIDTDSGARIQSFEIGSDRVADKLKPRRIANCGGPL